MRRRRIIWLAVAAAIVGVVLLRWPRGPREPVHQGERLGVWLANLNPRTFQFPLARESAEKAIRGFGTNAVPWLMHEFTRPVSRWRTALNGWVHNNTRWRFRFDDGRGRINTASHGLQLLGSAITPVLPELDKYLGDPARGTMAALAMAGAGEPALPWLVQRLSSTNASAQIASLFGLVRLVPTTEAALPPLLQALRSTNDLTQRFAFAQVSQISSRPDLTIPALHAALSDSTTRSRAAAALEFMRRYNAVPHSIRLRQLLEGTNPATVLAASNALFILENPALSPPSP